MNKRLSPEPEVSVSIGKTSEKIQGKLGGRRKISEEKTAKVFEENRHPSVPGLGEGHGASDIDNSTEETFWGGGIRGGGAPLFWVGGGGGGGWPGEV